MPSKKIKKYPSFSFRDTQKLGEEFAASLRADAKSGAVILALQGDLGAGKTTFTQGFFRGLGLKRPAQSPTFIIMRRHGVRKNGFKNIFHIDAYRLTEADQLAALGFEEIAHDPKNVILVEWAERAKAILPKSAIWISFTHGKKENKRTIVFK